MLIVLANITPMTSKPLILIGAMGCGKTCVGHRLACAIKHDFFDIDNELVKRTGVSIAHIFDVEGEAGFRQREATILGELCALKHIVLATGGGVVLQAQNREIMSQKGLVIYLKADIKTLLNRTADSTHRPLLQQSEDKAKTIADILTARAPLYEQCADMTIDIVGKKLYMTITEIREKLKGFE